MPQPKSPPCRLFVLLARQAPIAVILRKGPTNWVQQIVWNTSTDTFEFGHWFHGRVDGERSELSPDGRHFIYFASKYSRRQGTADATTTWTAISRPPWYTALVLWKNDDTTYFGGGGFKDDNTVLVNQAPILSGAAPTLVDVKLPRKVAIEYTKIPFGASMNIRRLERAGWQWSTLTDTRPFGCQEIKNGSIRERRHPTNGRLLVATTEDWQEVFSVRDDSSEESFPLDADWADWDHRGRLVFTKKGILHAAEVFAHGVSASSLLADFNTNKPERKESPAWASTW